MLFQNGPLEFKDFDNLSTLKIKRIFLKEVSVDPANLLANTTAETDVTIPGVEVGDIVIVNVPASLENDIVYSGVRVSAANTVKLRLSNMDDTNAVNGAALTWRFLVIDLT